MRNIFITVFFLLMVGCTTVQTHSYSNAPVVNDSYKNGQIPSKNNIQILYAEPKRNYESIGILSVRKYKPGFSDPTVSDAINELRQAGKNLGADAIIIRQVSSNNGTRFATIEGEAIRWR